MTQLSPSARSFDFPQSSRSFEVTTLDPEADSYKPEQTFTQSSPSLNPKTPIFVPVKHSRLNVAAPTFLPTKLATINPQDDSLAFIPRRRDFILPNARKDVITDYLTMLHAPQDAQVGRFLSDIVLRFNKGLHLNDPVLATIYDHINALKRKLQSLRAEA
jgi:hypothetical protein